MKALETNLPIAKIKERDLEKSKEFTLYKTEIYNIKTQILIKSESFYPDKKYYHIRSGNEDFYGIK